MDAKALHREGQTYAETALPLGHDWRTVKRYVEAEEQPAYQGKRVPWKLDPFKALIDQWLTREPALLATRIHQDLARDYGSAGCLRHRATALPSGPQLSDPIVRETWGLSRE
jgi:transposase